MPSSEIKLKVSPGEKHLDADCDPFLPLEVFDNTEYDNRTPKEWLALGKEADGQKPVPGKALLANGIVKDRVKQYEWMDIGMTAYDERTQLYQVLNLVFCRHEQLTLVLVWQLIATMRISIFHMSHFAQKCNGISNILLRM